MAAKRVLAIVLAGGEGKRLMPLTADRAKPAVPFGGIYRLIDFALSNIVNSRYLHVVVLTQYKSHSLDRHIAKTWDMSRMLGNYVVPVPAQQRMGKNWYLGSADAIYQSLNLLDDERPDIVVVVGADNIYRMDFSQMVDAHVASGAKLTVAGIRQPRELADQFGVIEADPADPRRIKAFREKPSDAVGLADSPEEVLVSMGNYVFDADALVEAVRADALRDDTRHDMGGDIVPAFVERGEAALYDFIENDMPGSNDRDRDYWRDVGTIDAYFEANMDLINIEPVFNLYNDEWPVYTGYTGLPPAKFVHSSPERVGLAVDSIISPGVVVSGAEVHASVLSPHTKLNSWSRVDNSVLLDNVTIARRAHVNRAILDKFVTIEEGASVGLNRELDIARGFTVTPSGITVVPKGTIVGVDSVTPYEFGRRLGS
ncbi:glucose-1-phosphate adenylyltransferase [Serinibacter arcticus]|uniref:Glucose-1-phosphate adenylyltransferase n=1 Tax=Serinibacter arcticus TaxID=1655435 RepID=A0A2U1ZRG3_9MICO|nr:glucose-1-phosphate adenylyltransferase [Serinibacter arcticus]PWD49543.1 glucose-1-phosphate adenylyltransferase [Serinibacter arcticus]